MVPDTSKSRNVMSHLDLLIHISIDDLVCSIFDKRDAFDFDIVNFPNLSGNISTEPACGTYILQLITYSRASHNYDHFSSRHSIVTNRLFKQGFSARKLMRTYEWISRARFKVQMTPSSMICNDVPMAQLYHNLPSADGIVIGAGCCAQGRACLLLLTSDATTDYCLVMYLGETLEGSHVEDGLFFHSWLCLLLFDVSIGFVSHPFQICQSFLSGCVVSFSCFFQP